jgi:hypothetical protein
LYHGNLNFHQLFILVIRLSEIFILTYTSHFFVSNLQYYLDLHLLRVCSILQLIDILDSVLNHFWK